MRMRGSWIIAGVGLLAVAGLSAMAFFSLPDSGAKRAAAGPQAAKTAAVDDRVASQVAKTVDVTIYGQQLAQVQETRTVTLKSGRNRIQLEGIAAQYVADSLRVLSADGPGKFQYLSATYQPANLTSDKVLAESVGQAIVVQIGDGRFTRQVKGTLKSVSGGSLVIEDGTSGDTIIVNRGDVINIGTAPRGLSNTAALIVETEVEKAGQYDLSFLYETTGLTWQAKHAATYDDDKGILTRFETTVSLFNQTGTTFENANVRLITGDVAGGRRRLYDAVPEGAALRVASAPNEPVVETAGEQKVYVLPGRYELKNGQVRQVPFYVAQNVPAQREYYVPTLNTWSEQGTKCGVSVRLNLTNDEKSNLGKPLPEGAVKVYQVNAAGKQQLTWTTTIGAKAAGEAFTLQIGVSSDVKWERKLVSSQTVAPPAPNPNQPAAPGNRVPEFTDHTWEVKLFNYKKDRKVEVIVQVAVPADQTIGNPLVRKSGNLAQAVVTVPAKGEETLSYTLRIQTR